MNAEHFDALVVGAGQAGPAVAARCARVGMSVALIERDVVGGTCVNTGCYPTKALVASARAIHMARRGAEFGFDAGAVRTDMQRVMARKDQIVGATRSNVERWIQGMTGVEFIAGAARFVAPRTVRVGARTVVADHVFINVGSRSARPGLEGIDSVPTLDNISILQLKEVPRHLLIVGASYIGLEYAQMMRRFGSEVTVIERSKRFLPREDEDVAEEVRVVLETEGIRFKLGAECVAFAPAAAGVQALTQCDEGLPILEGSHVLLATGRVPNTDDLGLDAAGVAVDARGYIEVDNHCRTSAAGVWAMGDCNGRGAFTHTAWNDHEIVVDHLFGTQQRGIDQRIPCYALYMDPPLARVGLTEQEARALQHPILVSKLPMARVGRAKESGETLGFMKAVVHAKTRRILGASILGLSADEAIHWLLATMSAGVPYTALTGTVPIHPTVSELLPTLLQQLDGQ